MYHLHFIYLIANRLYFEVLPAYDTVPLFWIPIGAPIYFIFLRSWRSSSPVLYPKMALIPRYDDVLFQSWPFPDCILVPKLTSRDHAFIIKVQLLYCLAFLSLFDVSFSLFIEVQSINFMMLKFYSWPAPSHQSDCTFIHSTVSFRLQDSPKAIIFYFEVLRFFASG